MSAIPTKRAAIATAPRNLSIAVRDAPWVAAAMVEGLPPNGATHVMRLSRDEAVARRIAAIVVETFDPATTAAAAFEEAPDPSDWNKGPWIVEAYFGARPDEANVRALVAVGVGKVAKAAKNATPPFLASLADLSGPCGSVAGPPSIARRCLWLFAPGEGGTRIAGVKSRATSNFGR